MFFFRTFVRDIFNIYFSHSRANCTAIKSTMEGWLSIAFWANVGRVLIFQLAVFELINAFCGCANVPRYLWSLLSKHREILLSFVYVVKDGGYRKHGNHKIGRESVSPSSRIKFLRCHRASFSWFADFSRRHDADSYSAGTNIWRDFSSSPLPFRSTPRWIFSLDPIPGEFPLLVTSFSASPVPVLFPRPAECFSLPLPVIVTYYLPFISYHLLKRIDSLRLLCLFSHDIVISCSFQLLYVSESLHIICIEICCHKIMMEYKIWFII